MITTLSAFATVAGAFVCRRTFHKKRLVRIFCKAGRSDAAFERASLGAVLVAAFANALAMPLQIWIRTLEHTQRHLAKPTYCQNSDQLWEAS